MGIRLTSAGAALFLASAMASGQTARPAVTGTAMIVGRVIDGVTGQPLAGTVVTLAGQGASPTPVLVDGQARFIFRGLPAGSYNLSAERNAYPRGAYGKQRADGPSAPLVLADGERVLDADIRVWPYASIAGQVVDDAGEPLVNVSLSAYRRSVAAGHWTLGNVAGATTDDRGAYRIDSLLPSDYVIAYSWPTISYPLSIVEAEAGAREAGQAATDAWQQELEAKGATRLGVPATLRPSSRWGDFVFTRMSAPEIPVPRGNDPLRIYQTTYAPSVDSIEGATHIALAAGENRRGVDLQLRLTPAFRVSGVVVGPAGPISHVGLRMRRADMKESAAPILDQVAVTMADGAGRFAFLGVPSGRFTIWAVTQGSDPLNASPAITVGDADVSGVEIALRPSPRVTGRVAFEGSTPPPPAAALRSLRITLDSADGQRGGPVVLAGGGPPRLAVDTTGALAGTGLLPGSYFVRVEMIPAGWFLKSVTAGGVNVADDVPLALSQSLDGLVVTLTDHDTALSGTVRTATGANDLTASVVVFPADRRLWSDYGGSPRRWRAVRTGRLGDYRIGNLPAGEYLAVAIADADASGWQEPATLERLARLASHVQVAGGAAATLDLRTSVLR